MILLVGCGRTKARECFELESNASVYRLPLAQAPKQADMGRAAQEENWRWRADLVEKEAAALTQKKYETGELNVLNVEVATYYRSYASEARAAADAWKAGDNAAIKMHTDKADAMQDAPKDVRTKLDVFCNR